MGNGHFIDSADLHAYITGDCKVDVTIRGVRVRIYRSAINQDSSVAVFDCDSKTASENWWWIGERCWKHNVKSACYSHAD